MASNALLFNAALTGFMSGMIAGQPIVDAVQANYAAAVAEAAAFATEIDSLIATDTAGSPQPVGSIGISIAGGAAIIPVATAPFESQVAKASLMQALSFGAAFQRFKTGDTAVSFLTLASAVRAAYFQTVLSGVYT